MTLTNWFYTNCTTVTWSYIANANDVYGQIDHTLGTQTGFRMIAWVTYDFLSNQISWAILDHTLTIATWWVHAGFMFDTNGGIAELSMNVPWCQSFTSSPSLSPIIIPQGSGMTFTCGWTNVSWYILNIFLSWGTTPIIQDLQFNNWGSNIRLTWANLATGDYIATCSVINLNYSWPQCWNQIAFHVGSTWTIPPPLTGTCNPNFQGEITFASSFGSTILNQWLGTYFTNRTGIMLQLGATEPSLFYVSGDFIGNPLSGNYAGTGIFNYATAPITLLNTNGWNYFWSTYSTGGWTGMILCTYTDATKRVYVDTLPPTTPSLITPATWTNFCPSLPLNVVRTPSIDSGAGLSNYKYEVYNNNGMITGIMLSWTIPNTVTGISLNISLLPLGTYYMRISAVDNVGITSTSTTVNFTASTQYCAWGTGVLIVTPTIWLRNLDLDKIYKSDPIYILGLTGPTLIHISKGMLFINNATGGNWTTGIVTSADTLYIEMNSSNTYDTTVTSEIHVLGLTWTFSLTTKKSSCILSAAEKLVIQNMYQNLKSQYNNNISKLADFLNTFQSMVKDETQLSNSCTLEYLLSLIEADLGSQWGINTSNHITPNCKEYSIGYDITQKAYYAPEMKNRYFFINRESLIRHLDYYNPWDCHINTYLNNFRTNDLSDPMRHTAPNGKIYHYVGQYGGYSAIELASPRYFDSLSSINMYVDLKNPPKDIWTHTVDTAFTPITYAAPNGKEYRIYKTDRWYMSYKLMRVRYYPTLSEIKRLIDVNNPSRY